jgi:hypothetical protein
MGLEDEGRQIFNDTFGSLEAIIGWDAVHEWNRLNHDGAGGITKGLCTPGSLASHARIATQADVGTPGGRKNIYSACLNIYDAKTMRQLYDEYVKFLTENPLFRKTVYAFESYPQEGVRAVGGETTAHPIRDANIVV